nr:uncharacterized protein LOC109150699 isoform X4 [Ipomoea batatas]
MERVLDLRITDALLRLARWLVTNFNPTDLTLELHSGIGFRITREDVTLLPHKLSLGLTQTQAAPSWVGIDNIVKDCTTNEVKGDASDHRQGEKGNAIPEKSTEMGVNEVNLTRPTHSSIPPHEFVFPGTGHRSGSPYLAATQYTDPTSGYAECRGRSHTICGTAKNVTLRSEMALLEDVNVFLNSLEILEICITID